ncbi:PepSY-associated TM helix domain-containing protein [Sphingomonas japonica]|uniref:Iron-regulated membrane protein n=1 Tax=Sphingomonas japonica TaxID=511662 RepID=A0ABX0TZ63_9SPHN|nr:PepSY-associated TM helix domain-containing protein [Sphingomonas japonica]NIJ22624.1 putative iron-regulated membrane protein [Sphingomonas japonica]
MTKIALRNFWFQVHKWIGLLLAVAVIPISITGAALVWHDGLEKLLHPDRFAVSGQAVLPPQTYAAAARGALAPGERLSRIEFPQDSGEPVAAQASRPGKAKGRPVRTVVYLDPADARVIETTASNASAIQFMHILHGSLFIPEVGRKVVGWIGWAMLASSLTGLWLWWPTVGRWVRGLRWRRHRNTDTNLHYLMGFWISVPLAILSFTGVWISFPALFNPLVEPVRAERPKGPDRGALMRARPIEEPATSLDTALARAAAAAPGDVRAIGWPTDVKTEWSIALDGGRTVAVTDADGTARIEPARGGRDEAWSVAQWMRRIHDGQQMPFAWQVIVFLGGLLPALLSITGIIMWLRARGWRAELKQRRKARARAAVAAE